jgi:hypothetical protein
MAIYALKVYIQVKSARPRKMPHAKRAKADTTPADKYPFPPSYTTTG